jgi:hypothetical protein
MLLALILFTVCRQAKVKPTAVLPEKTVVSPTKTPPPTPSIYTTQLSTYNLGDTTILQEHFPKDNRFYHMSMHLEGVIGVPESEPFRKLFPETKVAELASIKQLIQQQNEMEEA